MSSAPRLAGPVTDGRAHGAGEPPSDRVDTRPVDVDVGTIRRALQTYGWLGVAFGAALLAGVIVYAESLPPVYEAEAIVSFGPRVEAGAGADVVSLLLPRYDAVVGSQSVLRETAAELDVDVERVESALELRQPAETTNLEIVVTDRDPDFAVDAANRLSSEAVSAATDDQLVEAVAISQALPPETPSGPPRRLMEAAGFVVALVGAFFVPIAADRLRPRVTRLEDVTAALGLAGLGEVASRPSTPTGAGGFSAAPGASLWATRTALLRAAGHVGARSVALMGVSARTTASSATVAIGDALGRAGTRVLAVDARLRTSELSRLAGVAGVPGLLEMLEVHEPTEASNGFITPRREPSGLEVLGTGFGPRLDDPARPVEELLAQGFAAALERCATPYDLVLINAPSLEDGDDALIVADAADATVLLASPGESLTAIAAGHRMLQRLDTPVLGVLGIGFATSPLRHRRRPWVRWRRAPRGRHRQRS